MSCFIVFCVFETLDPERRFFRFDEAKKHKIVMQKLMQNGLILQSYQSIDKQ